MIVSFVPFVAEALIAFALLIVIIMRHMRRTAAAIADGERQLRHLALHDPVCGLPNRIYFSERLERAIAEARNGGPTTAVFYIDLDHFSDEFAIIMICAADNYSLQAVAERILAAICTPFVVSGHGINTALRSALP